MRFTLILCMVLFGWHTCASAEEPAKLTILTSFPPEFYTPFVSAFEMENSDVSVVILNKKTTAALSEIQRGNPRKFDIFWSSSPDAFVLLKSKGHLMPLSLGDNPDTLAVGGIHIEDPDNTFTGFALSGVGWMWKEEMLEREGLPVPESWMDLTRPIYDGHLAMSTPSRSGTTHLIVESILQQYGWEKGWAIMLAMAGNLKTVSARSFSVPEGILHGKYTIGLGIDFLAHSRPTLSFFYARPVFLSVASVAGLKGGKNEKSATRFARFLLSKSGQKILRSPDVRRMPVSRALHEPHSGDELYHLITNGHYRAYDSKLSRARYHLVNRLFDQMITYTLPERKRIWHRLLSLEQEAEKNGRNLSQFQREITALLAALPVSETESDKTEYRAIFTAATRERTPEAQAEVERWKKHISDQFNRAKLRLDAVEAHLLSEGRK